ncbi:hypothetical protein H1C71_023597 [Ictidomys tridecemlineatus]|nr:hypothetical protein H1C71_023597 [Ictidomys tridecemlineatus]
MCILAKDPEGGEKDGRYTGVYSVALRSSRCGEFPPPLWCQGRLSQPMWGQTADRPMESNPADLPRAFPSISQSQGISTAEASGEPFPAVGRESSRTQPKG